jgi:hypothetical protein
MNPLQAFRAGVDNRKQISLPGSEKTAYLHILSCSQEQNAEMGAERQFIDAQVPISAHNIDSFEQEKTIRKLFIALRDENGVQFGTSAEEFKNAFTRFEIDLLVEEYNAFTCEVNPSLSNMSDDKFDALLETVKKNRENAIRNISNTETLKRLIISLVEELANLLKGSGLTSL